MTIEEQIDAKIDFQISLSEDLENEIITNEEYEYQNDIINDEINLLNESLDIELTDVEKINDKISHDKVNLRKDKLTDLVHKMELNPLIDNTTEGLPMLSFFSNDLESYKYSDQGKAKFINSLSNHTDQFQSLLTRIVTLPNPYFPNGMTTIDAINYYL